MWAAERRARTLAAAYRSSGQERSRAWGEDAVDEALALMAIQSHAELGRARAEHIPRAKMAWARLAGGVIRALTEDLLALHSEDGLDRVIERAKELGVRLEARDAAKAARVTRETREGILLVSSIATTLDSLRRVRDGEELPSHETAGRASVLRQRWGRIGEPNAFVRRLVEECVARVLTGGSDAVRPVYTRALTHWVPAESQQQAQAADGTRLTWDDDDF